MKTIRCGTVLALAAILLLAFSCSALAATAVEKTDDRGKVTETVWQDENGNPAAGPDGYAAVRYTYAYADGQKTTEMYFDEAGNPYRMPGGYYGRAVTRGNKNLITLIEYLDANGALTMTEMGYARIYYYYRSFGAEYKCVYLGTKKGEVVIVPSLGYAQIETEYTGTIMTGRYYRDTKGKAIDSTAGYSTMIRKLNKSRQLVLQVYYLHADGKPATGPDGWSKCVMDRDGKGRITEIRYLDENGQLTDRGGAARETREYDKDGDAIVTRFDAQGSRISFGGDAVSVLRQLDGEQIIAETYLNEAGGPTALPDGYASAYYTYDDADRLTFVQYRSASGEKETCIQGYSAISQTWDEEGRLQSRIYLDMNGKNVNNRAGVCEERYRYDADGLLKEIQQFDADGNRLISPGELQ